MKKLNWDFNPRSLAGATTFFGSLFHNGVISIHAPSRERRCNLAQTINIKLGFQSTLPRGSDSVAVIVPSAVLISIHAPSRERPLASG